ncbi:MAG: aminopeptidase P family protein [Dysgonamonadaceae bacterium]|jgi:Xaa-Pro aminopeptidase|nr:aminopeptidase P family protein [Dysgonamonadaceae bacterium]
MFTREVYIRRREQLKKSMTSGLIILPGNGEAAVNYAGNPYTFRQDSSFIYFIGLDTPDLCCVIDVDSGNEYLFGDELTLDDIIWMGDLPSLKSRCEATGITNVLPLSKLKGLLEPALKSGRRLHYLKPYRYRNQLLLSELLGIKPDTVADNFSLELTKAVIALRMEKDALELCELEKAGEIGFQMHLKAMQLCKPGMSERAIAGTMEGIAIASGNRVSFPTILSQNGQILHNHNHEGILQTGRLMLTDAGAENENCYASDFTRTVAVGGIYTQRQKEIHTIVLQALNHSMQLIRPGIPYRDVHREAYRIVFEGLKAIGLMRGDAEEALACGAPALFMPHGLGHAMGLDVHDMEDLGETFVGYDDEITRSTIFGYKSLRLGRRLREGFVLTVEPGIYFIPQLIEKWKNEHINQAFICFDKLPAYYDFGGIRLEDDVVVTPDGCRLVYPKRLPVTIEEIEETIKSS